jgi:large subunit ribosomal protein L21
MYAIVEEGGKQYKLEEGKYLDIELLDAKENEKVTFDKIVMLVNGKKSVVGQPYVKSATVSGTIVKHDKPKRLLFTSKELKKATAKNKATGNNSQEL